MAVLRHHSDGKSGTGKKGADPRKVAAEMAFASQMRKATELRNLAAETSALRELSARAESVFRDSSTREHYGEAAQLAKKAAQMAESIGRELLLQGDREGAKRMFSTASGYFLKQAMALRRVGKASEGEGAQQAEEGTKLAQNDAERLNRMMNEAGGQTSP